MNSRIDSLKQSLADALPGAPFRERHCGVVDAPVEVVWSALHRLRWEDLRLSRPLLAARRLGSRRALVRDVLTGFDGLGAATARTPPRHVVTVMVGKPWWPVPACHPVDDIAAAGAFAEPGWLAYGWEWRLEPLAGGRTLVETTTLARPTDASAHRRFAAYWALIRLPSGLIRRELIAALARVATEADSRSGAIPSATTGARS